MNEGNKQILKNKCNFATNISNLNAFRQKEQKKQGLPSSFLPRHNSFHVLPSMWQAIYNIIWIMLSLLILQELYVVLLP